jgi:D-glycero-D-manno-heptose 1,7-bisphosphate phosphatase
MRKAVFIDRDGTLIKDIPYNANPHLISLEYFAAEMLQCLKRKDYLLILITNQSGIARGYFSEEDLYRMHEGLQRKLLEYNVQLDAIYYCPHLPDGIKKEYAIECDCRKPKPGLIYKAAKKFNINLNESWMIGDILNDVEAGNVAGCKTIFVNNGNETEWIINEQRIPEYEVENLEQATKMILKHELETV